MQFNLEKTLIFVDGENLTIRYEEMVKHGHIPRPDNIHTLGAFIWNQRVLDDSFWNVKRSDEPTSYVAPPGARALRFA